MLRNYLKMAFRSLSKNRLFTALNVTGLAIGMSVGLLIVNLVYDAFQFDQFHENKERLYRVISTPKQTGYRVEETATTPTLLAEKLKDEVPGVDEVVRIRRRFTGRIKTENGSLFTEGIYADPNFFKVFSFELEEGNPASALQAPNSIILTRSLAETISPHKSLMGQVLDIPDRGEFLVTGIAADPPIHSHIQFQTIVSFESVKLLEQQNLIYSASYDWRDFTTGYVYFLLEESQTLEQVQSWLNNTAPRQYEQFDQFSVSFATQKVTSIVPGKDLNNQIGAELIPLPIIILGTVAFAIVLSACFNYTNLSIARALRRSKEIGVRKIVGSTRLQVFKQFTVETIIVSLISVLFSYYIFLVIKPLFISSIPRIDQIMPLETAPELIFFFLAFSVVVALLAGLFPALFFSRIKPLLALRSKSAMKLFSHLNLRKALIVIQFSLSIIFLITMNVVSKQYRYSMAFDMGFQKENILNLSLNENGADRLIPELEKIPEIKSISASSMIVGTGANYSTILKNRRTNDSLFVNFLVASPKYFEIHGLQIVNGEIYPSRRPGEKLQKIMVNEEFVRFQGYDDPNSILGEVFLVGNNPVTITGVVKNFNYHHLEEPIRSLIFFDDPSRYSYLNLSVQSDHYANTFAKLENIWASVDEDAALEVQFLDDKIEETNSFFMVFVRVFGFLGFISTSIACLGLLGMAVFNAESRIKEIGVRKAIGASIANIIFILSGNFAKLMLVSSILGSSIAYILLEEVVLAEIHYAVGVGILEVLTAIALLFFLAILAIGSQTWKAARANPVNSLRHE